MLEGEICRALSESGALGVGRGPRRRSLRYEPYAEAGIEPRLEDLLGDPLTRLLMRRDGVSDSSLRHLIGETKERLRARCSA